MSTRVVLNMLRSRPPSRLATPSKKDFVFAPSRALASSSGSPDFILRSEFEDLDIPRRHFFDFLWSESVEKWGSRTALVNGETRESFTFKESQTQSYKSAQVFSSAFGLTKNDVLALALPNCPEYAFHISGASLVGVITTPMNPTYTPTEMAHQLDVSKAKAVITADSIVPRVREALKEAGQGTTLSDDEDFPNDLSLDIYYSNFFHTLAQSDKEACLISMDAEADYEDVKAWKVHKGKLDNTEWSKLGPPADFDFDNDILVMPFSSGTTGVSKGVVLTHSNVVSNMTQMCNNPDTVRALRFPTETFQPSELCVLPLYHVLALCGALFNTMHHGGQFITMTRFEPETFIRALRDYKPTVMHMVPPLVNFCVNHPAVAKEVLSSLEWVTVAADSLPQDLAVRFKDKAPKTIFREGWGMTELSPAATVSSTQKTVVGSCGKPLPNTELQVVDLDTGIPLGPHQKGELRVRGPQVMKGYFNNPAATAETIKDGWLHSGDLAYYDEEGNIFIAGRLKELIKVKGFQVPPAELEGILMSHPHIADAAVVGVPGEAAAFEVPKAYIVRHGESLTEDQVHEFIDSKVAEYKRLQGGVEFVESIPKSPAGKTLRRLLTERAKRGLGQA